MAIKNLSIPQKFQLPTAVILGVLLVVLLGVKTGVIQAKEIFQKLKEDDVGQLEMISMDSMMAMIGDASAVLEGHTTSTIELIPVERDPFKQPSTLDGHGAVISKKDPGIEPPSGTKNRGRGIARTDWLDEAELEGTLLTESQSSAIVNGQFVREGDNIKGFEVVRITERAIFLTDEFGESVVRMPEE